MVKEAKPPSKSYPLPPPPPDPPPPMTSAVFADKVRCPLVGSDMRPL